MRKAMEAIEGTRGTFKGTFVRMGNKPCTFKRGREGFLPTLLLKNISDMSGNRLADHMWFNYTLGFMKLGELNEGDIIQFDGRCKPYEKGYKGYRDDVYYPIEKDFKFGYPTKITLIR